MTIGSIVLIVIGAIVLIGGVCIAFSALRDDEPGIAGGSLLVALLIGGALIIVPIIYSNTEAGKRALKDQESNFGDGIERTVTVYDINGEIIEQYHGKFDVETTAEYIIFDDENGKRHMIYYTTGTVIIDEK